MSAEIVNDKSSGTLAAAWHAKRLWVLHVLGNALLFAAGYAWLWIPDAHIWQLIFSALFGVLIVAAALWLHGATLVFFRKKHRGEENRLWPAFRATLPRLPALAVSLAPALLILWLIGLAHDRVGDCAAVCASWLTLHLRKPVHPATIAKVISAFVWLLSWILTPLVLLPLALQVSVNGFAGFARIGWRGVWKMLRSIRLWLGYAVLFAIGAYLPDKIVSWVPQVSSLKLEFASASLRFLIAYLLTVTAWIVLLSLLARLSVDDADSAPVREPVPVAPGSGHSADPAAS